MPEAREWVTHSSSKKKKVKIFKACLHNGAKPRHRPAIHLGEVRSPGVSKRSLCCTRGEEWHTLRQSSGGTAEEPSLSENASATTTAPPNPYEEEGEVTSCDADIPDSVARALLEALQDKRKGHQLPAAMVPPARVRASQLHNCIAKGTEPTEARPGDAGPDCYGSRTIRSASPGRQGVYGKPDA